MNFSTIASRVEQYMDRKDLHTDCSDSPTKIENWINDTRVDLALKHNFRYLYTEASATCTVGTKRYALPADYLGHLVVWCANKKLMRVDPREFDELSKTNHDQVVYPRSLTVEDGSTIDSTTTNGPPDYYIERGMEFELYPTPDAAYTITVSYYQQPTAYDHTQTTAYDYMMIFHYEAVIWGACVRGAMYLDDDANVEKFTKLYDKAITEMLKREQDIKHEDQHYRMKTYKDFDLTQSKRLFRVS